MITLMDKLMGLGSGAATAAPTDMSQIKVPQMPMDLAGTIPAANDQISYAGAQKAVDNSVDWGGAAMGLMSGLVGSGGGEQQAPAQIQHLPGMRMGSMAKSIKPEEISRRNWAAQQGPQLGGLMSQKG